MYSTIQKFGIVKIVLGKKRHLFDQEYSKNSNICKILL